MFLLAEPILNRERPLHVAENSARLIIFLVGNDPASELYVSIKLREAVKYGVQAELIRFEATASSQDLEQAIFAANADTSVDAMIVQLPLPGNFDTETILDCIAPEKDVDNLTGHSKLVSPMVQAVEALINEYKISLVNKKLCVVGRGRLVGQPIYEWLVSQGYTPESVHRSTPNRNEIIKNADVVISGAGTPRIIHGDNTRTGQTLIDCSGNDIDVEAVQDKAAALTPKKGGVGPLTVHYLLMNSLKARSI